MILGDKMNTKISVSFPEEMIKRIHVEAGKNNQKISQFIQMCVEHEFNVIDAENAISDLCGADPEAIYKGFNELAKLNDNLKSFTEFYQQKGTDKK